MGKKERRRKGGKESSLKVWKVGEMGRRGGEREDHGRGE
jgi:hypothetical protein